MITAAEVLVLSYANGLNVAEGLHHNFWRNYAINPNKVLAKLRSKGLIMLSDDIETTLLTYKAKDLQEFCISKGIAKSGTKSDIIKRMLANFEINELRNYFSSEIYNLTQEGNELLKNNLQVVYVHKYVHDDSITIQMAHELKIKNPTYTPEKVIVELYDREIKRYLKDTELWQACAGYIQKAGFLMQVNLPELAIVDLNKAAYIEAAGIKPIYKVDGRIVSVSLLVGNELGKENRLDIFLVNEMKKCLSMLGISTREELSSLQELIKNTKIPYQFFTDIEVLQIITWELEQEYDQLDEFYKKNARRKLTFNENKGYGNRAQQNKGKSRKSLPKPKGKGFLGRIFGDK